MEVYQFFVDNWQHTLTLALQHVYIVAIAVVIAIGTGVPIGIWITFNRRAASIVLYLAGIIMTIPSIALFGIMIPFLSVFGYGIGTVPAVVALVLYSQLPIIRNTYAAIKNVDPNIIDAGRGMGMTGFQVLFKVQLPLALSIIFAGVRVAVVMSIGIAAIAAYIGAGGLGHYIFMGISQSHDSMIKAGAVIVALMAIAVDYTFGLIENRLISKGLQS
jgi:osmoprotectant transport system permease protein